MSEMDEMVADYIEELDGKDIAILKVLSHRRLAIKSVMEKTGLDWDDVEERLRYFVGIGLCDSNHALSGFGIRMVAAIAEQETGEDPHGL